MYKGCCCCSCWSGRSYCFKSHFYSLKKLLTVASYRLIRKGREKLHWKLKKGRSQNYFFCISITLPVVKLGQFSAGLLIQAISLGFQLLQLLLSQFCKRWPWWNWQLNFNYWYSDLQLSIESIFAYLRSYQTYRGTT